MPRTGTPRTVSTLAAPPQATDPAARLHAVLRAADDPHRLAILRLLATDCLAVHELALLLDLPQPLVSHHLKLLAAGELLTVRRDGNTAFQHRAEPPDCPRLGPLVRALLDAADALPLDPDVVARQASVDAARARHSAAFFERHAATFRQAQDRIAPPGAWHADLLAVIDRVAPAPGHALEIGPGAGQLLPELAARAAQVTALDRSPAMLALARQRCAQAGLAQVAFIAADADQLAPGRADHDLVVLSMVLHHLRDPAAALARLATWLAPGGALVVAELAAHRQGWVRDTCGDIWLGFTPGQLEQWLQAAGLVAGSRRFLAQRNGFALQIHAGVRAGSGPDRATAGAP